jgi:hypothetical protein
MKDVYYISVLKSDHDMLDEHQEVKHVYIT